jgi:glycosyltransferase involved in cell wall biosynthesis
MIVTNTDDYAEHSDFLKNHLEKIRAIMPPIELVPVNSEDIARFRTKYGIRPDHRPVGMAARLATEKGVEYLVQALPAVLDRHPGTRILFAGQHEGVLGEEAYAQKLAPLIQRLGEHWKFLGILPPKEWSAFFNVSEVTVLPSINSTESFGMVQIESMISGTPVIATDVPGVRQAVKTTGMGVVVPPKDAQALAKALIDVLEHPNGYRGNAQDVQRIFAPEKIARQYEELFSQIIRRSQGAQG